MRRVLLILMLVVAPLSGAAAQGSPESRIQAARRQAEQAGIPVSLLETKISEGRAKGVPMDRIAAVVERRLASLARAREAMGGARAGLAAADLAVGADAIEAGVEPRALGHLAGAAPAGQRAVAIAVLTQLVASGMASERALERVTLALQRGPEALRQLPGEASEQARAAGAPGAGRGSGPATGARGRGAGRGQGAGPPASVPGPGKKPDNPGAGRP